MAFVTSTVVQKSESPFNLFGGEGRSAQGEDTGSGIVINGNGTILTNYHVVENAVKVTVSFEKGKNVEAKVVGKDPSNDLAVLRIPTDGLTLHPLTLGDSSTAQVGDPVLAIGNPFDLERTLTTGVISALQRQITAPNGFTIDNVLQTDAPINPGNSGGPLLNAAGEVIGINSQIETGGCGDGSVGIGFAVPINTAKSELAAAGERRDGARRLPRPDLADDRRLAVGAEPAGQERRARAERARRAPPPQKPASAAATSPPTPKTARWRSAATSSSSSTAKPSRSSEDLANDDRARSSRATRSASDCCARTGNGSYEPKTVTVTLGSSRTRCRTRTRPKAERSAARGVLATVWATVGHADHA